MSDHVMTTEQVRNLYRFAYGWRTEDDLDAGETDLSNNRELQAAEFDKWLRQMQAEVWEQGYSAAEVGHHPMNVTDALPINPYRKETP